MAGTPIAVFFSNLYLTELDKCFDNRDDIIYCRYSDDIIVFAKKKERLLLSQESHAWFSFSGSLYPIC